MAHTKKHYAAIAGLVRSSLRDTHKGVPGPEQTAAIALAVAVVKEFFPSPRFDEARFIAACTPDDCPRCCVLKVVAFLDIQESTP